MAGFPWKNNILMFTYFSVHYLLECLAAFKLPPLACMESYGLGSGGMEKAAQMNCGYFMVGHSWRLHRHTHTHTRRVKAILAEA